MIFESELNNIKNSEEYKDFTNKNKTSYLSSVVIIDKKIQFDFYNPDTDNITSFSTENDEIKQETSDVFRKEKTKLNELKLEPVKINLEEAKKIMAQVLEKFKQESTRKFIILQKEDYPIWNISYLTKEFKLLHVKINAKTGKTIHENLQNALDFKAQ